MERDTENFRGLDNHKLYYLNNSLNDNKSSYSYTFERDNIADGVRCVNVQTKSLICKN